MQLIANFDVILRNANFWHILKFGFLTFKSDWQINKMGGSTV